MSFCIDVIRLGESFGSSPTHLQVTNVISSLTYWKKNVR